MGYAKEKEKISVPRSYAKKWLGVPHGPSFLVTFESAKLPWNISNW